LINLFLFSVSSERLYRNNRLDATYNESLPGGYISTFFVLVFTYSIDLEKYPMTYPMTYPMMYPMMYPMTYPMITVCIMP